MEIQGFDLIGFDLFGVDLNSIDINTDNSVSVKDDYIPTIIKPYIKGHITDSSSTFTFTVNSNESITVDVGADGWWKWKVDRTITSLQEAFKDKSMLDECYLYKIATSGSCQNMFYGCLSLTKLLLDNSLSDTSTLYGFTAGTLQKDLICKNVIFDKAVSCRQAFLNCNSIVGLEKATFESCSNTYQMFRNYKGESLNLQIADFSNVTNSSGMFGTAGGGLPLENLNIKKIGISVSLAYYSKLTEQSVVNIFNAVCVDGITLTFNATVKDIIDAQMDAEEGAIYDAYMNSDYDFDYA